MMRAERVAQTFNGQAEWRVQGAYFKLLSTVNPVTVELWRQGQRVLYAGGAEGGFYQHIDFDQVKIATGGAEAVAWIFGPAGGGSDRFTGDVDVIDDAARELGIASIRGGTFADSITDAAGAFRVADTSVATSAKYSACQVKNPAGSGMVVYVDSIRMHCDGTAARVFAGFYDTDLATDGGTLENLLRSGAASAAHIRREATDALLSTIISQAVAPANGDVEIRFNPPLRIDEGEGCFAQCGVVNTVLHATFAVREVDA